MAAGLKTIIALSFVRRSCTLRVLRRSLKLLTLTLMQHLGNVGPSNRLPPRHPVLGAVQQLPPAPGRCDVRDRAAAELDLRTVLKPR